MSSSNKRRVYVSIHHRDRLSAGSNRAQLEMNAYHWGIMTSPKKPKGADSNGYDVSDAITIDPITKTDTNPNLDWRFREKPNINPLRSGHLIGKILIGKIPNNITDAQLKLVLQAVPLPIKDADPPQSCVTWILAAVAALQNAGIARRFNIPQFMTWALSQADPCKDSRGRFLHAQDFEYTAGDTQYPSR